MGNFKLDYYLSKRLRTLSDLTNKSEMEILEEMFTDFESTLAWSQIQYKDTQEIKINKVKPPIRLKTLKY